MGFLILVMLLFMRRPFLQNMLLASSYASHYYSDPLDKSNSLLFWGNTGEPQPLEIWSRREAHPDPDAAVEDAYRGAFRFVDSPACSGSNRRDLQCTIYFPSYDPQYPTTCWNNSIHNRSSSSNNDAAPSLCMMTLRGAKGHEAPNQDRSVVLVQQQKSASGSKNNRDWIMLAALFDGHGDLGHVTSQIAINELVVKIVDATAAASAAQQHQPQQQMFQSTYLETDRGRISQIPRAGTTAVTVLQQGRKVHLASAGDSTAVLVQWFGDEKKNHHQRKESKQPQTNNAYSGVLRHDTFPWYRRLFGAGPNDETASATTTTTTTTSPYKIIARAVQHKPADPTERTRIEAAGGFVHIPFVAGQSSRVVYPIHDDESGLMMQMALAMSRSLGDKDGKDLGVVIADPDVVTFDLNDYIVDGSDRFFVVLASDGVIDMVPADHAVDVLGKALYDSGGNLHAAVQDILTLAVEKWKLETGNTYRDDISLTVQKIELPL